MHRLCIFCFILSYVWFLSILYLFNITNWDETFSFDFRKAGLEGYYEVRDLWEREGLGSVDKIVTKVKSHGVKLYKLSKKQV